MPTANWRPWGLLEWLLDKISIERWCLLGSLSTEERSLAVIGQLHLRNRLDQAVLMRIIDPPSYFDDITEARLEERFMEMNSLGIDSSYLKIPEYGLFERTDTFVQGVLNFAKISSGNVIVDISTFPKRIFFPVVRMLLENKSIVNLIATYTVARSYSLVLAEDPEPWNHLPLFAPIKYPEPEVKVLLIGIGFQPLGLPDFFDQGYSSVSVKLLLPFPPGPPRFQRNWEFIRILEKNLSPPATTEPIRINSMDVSECFDTVCSVTERGSLYSVLAPYGPKPISLAMCLYATLVGAPVYYTQPRAYNPDYSIGFGTVDGVPETYAYCLRLEGQDLYTVPSGD